MGHPEPFDLRYVAIGNEDCGKKNYRGMPAPLSVYMYPYNALFLILFPSFKLKYLHIYLFP